jgi:hypothetical protein
MVDAPGQRLEYSKSEHLKKMCITLISCKILVSVEVQNEVCKFGRLKLNKQTITLIIMLDLLFRTGIK